MKELKDAIKAFDRFRASMAKRLNKLIDERLEKIRKDVPEAAYLDAMGVSYLHSPVIESLDDDPLYLAYQNIFYEKQILTEEANGEPLSEIQKKAIQIQELHDETIKEIMDISIYLTDEVGYTYG